MKKKTENRHKKILDEKYKVYDNKIYIDAQDTFYNNIYTIAYKKGINLNQYIKSLGYERIMKKNLPSDYIPYNWKFNKEGYIDIIMDKANMLLEEISNSKGEIFIKSDSYEYNTLWKYGYILDLSINSLIKDCGFTRIYRLDKEKKVEKEYRKVFEANDILEYKKKEILKELMNLKSIYKEESKIIKKIKRNSKLPKLLKKLYMNECQLCSENQNRQFRIEMGNGENYIEVHHITQISEGKYVLDESENDLDSVENCVVVCCFHHKYLHYHNGGFKKLKKTEGKIFFESEIGERIPIITN